MLNGDRQHQGSPPSVLGDFPGGIGIPLHKRHHPRRSKGAVKYRASRRAYVRQIVPYASPSFHQLYLFLVDFHNSPVRIRQGIVSYHETIGKRSDLVIISDPGHRSPLGNDIFKIF